MRCSVACSRLYGNSILGRLLSPVWELYARSPALACMGIHAYSPALACTGTLCSVACSRVHVNRYSVACSRFHGNAMFGRLLSPAWEHMLGRLLSPAWERYARLPALSCMETHARSPAFACMEIYARCLLSPAQGRDALSSALACAGTRCSVTCSRLRRDAMLCRLLAHAACSKQTLNDTFGGKC